MEVSLSFTPTLTQAALATAFLAALVAAPASAQGRSGGALRVTVALVDSLPVQTAKVMVVRKANGGTLVALDRRHATPDLLGMGLDVARKAQRTPLGAGEQQVIPIQGGVARGRPSAKRTAALRTRLAELGRSPRTALGGFGHGQLISFADERGGR